MTLSLRSRSRSWRTAMPVRHQQLWRIGPARPSCAERQHAGNVPTWRRYGRPRCLQLSGQCRDVAAHLVIVCVDVTGSEGSGSTLGSLSAWSRSMPARAVQSRASSAACHVRAQGARPRSATCGFLRWQRRRAAAHHLGRSVLHVALVHGGPGLRACCRPYRRRRLRPHAGRRQAPAGPIRWHRALVGWRLRAMLGLGRRRPDRRHLGTFPHCSVRGFRTSGRGR